MSEVKEVDLIDEMSRILDFMNETVMCDATEVDCNVTWLAILTLEENGYVRQVPPDIDWRLSADGWDRVRPYHFAITELGRGYRFVIKGAFK